MVLQAGEDLDELGSGGDVQLAIDDERAVSAQVGDLRDLPAGWATVRARPRDATAPRESLALQDEPHRRAAVGLHAPVVREAAYEKQAEPARLVQSAEAGLGREARTVV